MNRLLTIFIVLFMAMISVNAFDEEVAPREECYQLIDIFTQNHTYIGEKAYEMYYRIECNNPDSKSNGTYMFMGQKLGVGGLDM